MNSGYWIGGPVLLKFGCLVDVILQRHLDVFNMAEKAMDQKEVITFWREPRFRGLFISVLGLYCSLAVGLGLFCI